MPSLRLYQRPLEGTAFVEDLTYWFGGWRRSIRRGGGYWRGSFPISGEPGELARFFYERMGCKLKEESGGFKTWEGIIYEMDLTIGGATRRRSLDLMANKVTATYIDTAGDVQTSAAAENAQSQAIYGVKEELITLDGYPQTASEKRRDTFLKENAWSWARPVGNVQRRAGNELRVAACGLVFTANWKYQTAGDDSTDDVSTYVREIVETDCQFLLPGSIDENTLQVKKGVSIPTRAFDVIGAQVELGDASGNPWRFWVDNDGRANYRKIDTTPAYFLRGGELYTSAGGAQPVDPWTIKPGVVRDLNYPVGGRREYSGWLADQRDFFIDEVEVGPGGWVLKSDLFEESELIAAQQAYEEELESQSEAAAGVGGGEDRLNWKRRAGLKEGTSEWDEAVRLGKRRWLEKYRGKK